MDISYASIVDGSIFLKLFIRVNFPRIIYFLIVVILKH